MYLCSTLSCTCTCLCNWLCVYKHLNPGICVLRVSVSSMVWASFYFTAVISHTGVDPSGQAPGIPPMGNSGGNMGMGHGGAGMGMGPGTSQSATFSSGPTSIPDPPQSQSVKTELNSVGGGDVSTMLNVPVLSLPDSLSSVPKTHTPSAGEECA